ncbi:Fe3+-hydroxamate ABC transporter periplasmic binding protein [Alcanivorax hongdengensis A-11-3]|uniref:Fe3+-hydroxamate ABC transporter periplasmic binding protein n=1 Tax=Alcanivorax hongdengensis A-11-3 TaxID=1177179 RepID=L0WFM8_9GAMM|nr:cobalamin-binding protein [Alcanivorax hongdengensis]EKF75509.1 Fe3+-hydroxamate ABC transporter periplasmic binding protein [Alcanivorax hongdengensis A-11-3]
MLLIRLLIALSVLLSASSLWAAQRCVTDDADQHVCVPRAASRIVALSPGATELLFAAGAGDQVVGAVTFSDYPPAAKNLPRVGSYQRLDLEAIAALKPDLVVAWRSGNPQVQTRKLQSLGLPVYYSEPRHIEDIATSLERLATLAGSEQTGQATAKSFRDGMAALGARYQTALPVRVFYQVWKDPLMTVNSQHLINEVISLCGGVNVFADLPRLAPRVSREAVLEANPEAIVAGGMGEENDHWLKDWKAFPAMAAVQRGNLFFVSPSTLQRPSPRLLIGARTLCTQLETARGRR